MELILAIFLLFYILATACQEKSKIPAFSLSVGYSKTTLKGDYGDIIETL
jgi:hypothetical protein